MFLHVPTHALLLVCVLSCAPVMAQSPAFPAGWISLADHGGDLQAAIQALPSEGGTVLVPRGLWVQPGPVVITSSDVSIVGAGQRVSQLAWPSNGDGLVVEATLQPTRRFALRDVLLSGGTTAGTALRCAGSPQAGVTNVRVERTRFVDWERGVRAANTWRATIAECTFTACRAEAIRLDEATNAVTVRDAVIGLSTIGILVNGPSNAIRLEANNVEHCSEHGILVRRGEAIAIESNYVESIGPHAHSLIELGEGNESPSSCSVRSNYLNAFHTHGPADHGVHVHGGRGHSLAANSVRNARRSGIRVDASVRDYAHWPGAYDGNARDEEIFSPNGLSYQANGTLAAPTLVPQGGPRARDMGTQANPYRDVHSGRVRLADPITGSEAWIQIGVGPPRFAAPPGSIYLDTQQLAKARLYVNVSDRNPGTAWRICE
ncbi:MAG: right-handed parallel beta-helix repeat-containing protein [Planctomycetes bacterium]|nr:right-handed parallel beta-helix repeat-containing protein [Planctomycetota bacterium]